MWVTAGPLADAPSPNSQSYPVMAPWAAADPDPSNVLGRPAAAATVVILATGLCTGGIAVPAAPARSIGDATNAVVAEVEYPDPSAAPEEGRGGPACGAIAMPTGPKGSATGVSAVALATSMTSRRKSSRAAT